jgi:hypothetical protein
MKNGVYVNKNIATVRNFEVKKLRGLSPRANYTEQQPLASEVSVTFCG